MTWSNLADMSVAIGVMVMTIGIMGLYQCWGKRR